MSKIAKSIYRVLFVNQGKLYELYARSIYQGELFGFIEVEELIFGERSSLLVNPAEERLQNEFSGVQRTFIPLHYVVRIDEVEPCIADALGHHRRVLSGGVDVRTIFIRMYTNHLADEGPHAFEIITGQMRAHESVEFGFS